MEIAALVSGGVDSSVVVYRLKEMGTIHHFYIKIGMKIKKDILIVLRKDIEIVSYVAKNMAAASNCVLTRRILG